MKLLSLSGTLFFFFFFLVLLIGSSQLLYAEKWEITCIRNSKVVLVGKVVVAAAKSLQSCLTLCDPIDGSPPGSPVPGILQARTLEQVAISFSNARK